MGDFIEITTRPEEKSTFYKIPSGGLKVYIKANSGNAAIGLTKKIDDDCEYWIVLGHNRRTWIKKIGGYNQIVQTPNILSADEYRCFWITWNGLSIKLGRDGEVDPIISFSDTKARQLNYVSFAVKGGDSPVHWKFELPPVIPKLDLRPVTGGEVQWVQADNQLPDGAVIGGYENDALYIIRAAHRGSLTPGKFVSSEGVGYISWGSEAHEKRNFEILVGFDCTWVHTSEDKIPVDAIVGGYAENTREKLYIGRASHNGHLIPGKVQPSHSVCYIPYEGREIGHRTFEILVGSDINARCSNRVFRGHMDIDSPTLSHDEHTEDDDMDGFEYGGRFIF